MSKKQKASLKKCLWKDVRKDVAKVNPGLAKAIDQVDPTNKHVIYKVRYPFGSYILKNGKLQLPTKDGEIVDITDARIDPEIRKDLAYTPNMPIGVVLKHTCELYWTIKNSITPFIFMHPGRIFSLWGMLQKTGTSAMTGKMWHISAGARSLFMLPKISDALCYKRVQKEFNLHLPAPKNFLDQHISFSELANSPEFPQDWNLELIFFSNQWLESLSDPSWKELRIFLLETGWNDTAFMRDKYAFDAVFSIAQIEKNLKPNPYLSDTVKHLYSIARGTYPGFKIAVNDTAAPVVTLQDIFANIYDLKFRPTMVYPDYLSQNEPPSSMYYSLAIPTLTIFSPSSRKALNKMSDIREIKHIMKSIKSYILTDKLNLKGTPIYKLIDETDYDFFHSNHDTAGDAKSTMELVKLDKALIKEEKKYPDKPFCQTSPFLRGCILISKQQ